MYLDILFPKAISIDGICEILWDTDDVLVQSGHRDTNANWTEPIFKYEVSHAARLPERWGPLRDFWMQAQGKGNTWRYFDHLDHSAAAGEGVFSMIDSTHFQMKKRYRFGSGYRDVTIEKPDAGIVVTGGTSPVVDRDTGIVTVSGSTPISWVGEFFRHCMFETDSMRQKIIDITADGEIILGWNDIPISSVRPD